jgi:hypothetical protein
MESFAKFGHEVWQRVADKYDFVWGSSTRQFIPPLFMHWKFWEESQSRISVAVMATSRQPLQRTVPSVAVSIFPRN